MTNITYTIILLIVICNPTHAWWSWIEDTVNTIKTAAGEFATWGDALADADIPILSDVAGGADIFKGWVEDGFDKATGELGDQFDDVTDFTRRLISFDNALGDIEDGIKDTLQPSFDAITGDLTKILELLTNPFSILALDTRIQSLGNTLKVCMSDLTDAVVGDLPFPDLFDPPDILPMDFDTIIYQLAAIPLLPIADQIEFVCIDTLDLLTNAIRLTQNIPLASARRRTMENDQNIYMDYKNAHRRRELYTTDCDEDDGLCTPASPDWNDWSGEYNDLTNNIANVISISVSAAGCFTEIRGNDFWHQECSPTTEFLWQTVEFVFTQLQEHLEDGCKLVKGCAADVQSGCQPAVKCSKGLALSKKVLKVVERILWAIDFHNGEVASAKKAAHVANSLHILHNQHAIKSWTKTEIDAQSGLITTRFTTVDTTLDTLRAYLKTEIDAQSGLITTRFNTVDAAIAAFRVFFKQEIDAQSGMIGNRFNSVDAAVAAFRVYFKQQLDAQSGMITNRFDSVDAAVAAFRVYFKQELDAQSTMITTRFDTLTDDMNRNFAQQTDLMTRRFNTLADNMKRNVSEVIRGIMGTIASIENSQLQQGYTLKRITEAIGNLQANFDAQYTAAKSGISEMIVSNWNDKGAGKVSINGVSYGDLIILGTVFIALNAMVTAVVVIGIMKCCYGRRTGHGFAPVPKYDYSTSDVEDVSK